MISPDSQNIRTMPSGPFQGHPLVSWKRSIRSLNKDNLNPIFSSLVKETDILIDNFSLQGKWWILSVPPEAIQSTELISQIRWSNKDHVHLLLRLQFQHPVLALRQQNDRVIQHEVSDIVLTVNPHEAVGQQTDPRKDGIHTHTFRILPTEKFLKKIRQSPDVHFFSWKLSFSEKEKTKLLSQFAKDSEKYAGKDLFFYTDKNCSFYLWNSLIHILSVRKNSEAQTTEEWQKLSKRGKWGVLLAKKLSLQPQPSYFFSQFYEWKKEVYQSLEDFIEINTPENFPTPRNINLEISPKRNTFLKALYDNSLIDENWLPYFLGDKLLVGEIIEKYLGPSHEKFHLKSRGIIHLLSENYCINQNSGELVMSKAQVLDVFKKEFPKDFIVKRVMDANSGASRIFSSDEFIDDIFSKKSQIYKPHHLMTPYYNEKYEKYAITTGESYFAMGRIERTRISKNSSYEGEDIEYRSHSLSQHVVIGGSQNRWDHFDNSTVISEIQNFIGQFIKTMPLGFFWRQAFSFDVAAQPHGAKSIVEINTNRGINKHWSDFLRDPRIIGSHVRTIEKHWNWSFQGVGGLLLRKGLGNIKNHIINEILYYNWKMQNEEFDPEYVIFSLKKQNTKLLQEALQFSKYPTSKTTEYLDQLAEFSSRYINKVSKVSDVESSEWRDLCQWLYDLEPETKLHTSFKQRLEEFL